MCTWSRLPHYSYARVVNVFSYPAEYYYFLDFLHDPISCSTAYIQICASRVCKAMSVVHLHFSLPCFVVILRLILNASYGVSVCIVFQ